MNKQVELICEVCNKPFIGDEPQYCCSGLSNQCGCMGQPIDGPIACSDECYNKFPLHKSGGNQ